MHFGVFDRVFEKMISKVKILIYVIRDPATKTINLDFLRGVGNEMIGIYFIPLLHGILDIMLFVPHSRIVEYLHIANM